MSHCLGFVTITFDDIFNASQIQGNVPSLYNCFKWVNGWYLNVTPSSIASGYKNALASGVYVVLNRNGTSMNMTTTTSSFNVYSFVATGAYYDSLHLSMQGIRGNSVIAYRQDVLVNTTYANTISLNWINLTTLNFQSYYVYSYQNYTGLGFQFALDNLNVTLN